jgi:hypothetical protein
MRSSRRRVPARRRHPAGELLPERTEYGVTAIETATFNSRWGE